jgi:ribonuclease HII
MKAHPIEKAVKKEGFFRIAGMDEAGRGPWAGPLIAAAVILPAGCKIKGINDSKKLTSYKREELFASILKRGLVGIGIVTNAEIDQKGLGFANKLAFYRAFESLADKPDYLLIDGIGKYKFEVPYKTVKFGDSLVKSIAAASIVAKVVRDVLMDSYELMYPQYGFQHHKGYGTKLHLVRLSKYGPCLLHRQSFAPIKNLVNGSRNT